MPPRLQEIRGAPSGNYVDVVNNDSGCWSYVGMWGNRQELHLGNGCFDSSTIEHEFLHALGVHHEQNRPDRDQFVDILWDNIKPDSLPEDCYSCNFEKKGSSVVLGYGPYDFGSVMHYSDKAFSRNGRKTIRGKKCSCFGRADGMSEADSDKLKHMYNCP